MGKRIIESYLVQFKYLFYNIIISLLHVLLLRSSVITTTICEFNFIKKVMGTSSVLYVFDVLKSKNMESQSSHRSDDTTASSVFSSEE